MSRTSSRQTTELHALRAASAIARARGSFSTPADLGRQVKALLPDASAAACRRAADTVIDAREAQQTFRGVAGPRHTPARVGRMPGPVAPLAARLAATRKAKVREAFLASEFRVGPNVAVVVVLDDGRAGVSIRHDREWRSGRGGFGWVTTAGTVTLTVPTRWAPEVRDRGLDRTEGMMTLAAEQVAAATGDVEVYSAVWLRQGRGYTIERETGCLAVHVPTGTVYHSTSTDPAKAARGLARQMRSQGTSPEVRDARRAARQERQAAKLTRLIAQLSRFDLAGIEHVEVSIRDSLKAGNCEAGTLAFAARCADGRDSATIGEIAAALGRHDLAALAGSDLALARQLAAACLVAIRRDRNARRLVTA